MNNCIICSNTGKSRRFFIDEEPLCDSDYIDYLELLITDMNETIPPKSANNAFSRLRMNLNTESKKI